MTDKIDKIKKRMAALGVYKKEFDDTIERYCQMRKEYDILYKRYEDEGFQCTVKSAAGEKKNPLVSTLESLRKDMLALENALGLNPAGLLKLRDTALEPPAESSKKASLFKTFEGGV